MWQLVDVATGNAVYRNLWDQWDACKASFHEDGSKYKKAEALKLKSGDVVYRCFSVKKFIKLPVVEDGVVVNEMTRTTVIKELRPYRLEKMPE